VLSYDLEPTAPSPASECRQAIDTGSRKTERGDISHGKGDGGTQIIRQHKNFGTLYTTLSLRWKRFGDNQSRKKGNIIIEIGVEGEGMRVQWEFG
jgi:hypothetical protein